jgi:hypothetical protein
MQAQADQRRRLLSEEGQSMKIKLFAIALLLALPSRPASAQGTMGPPNPIACNQQAIATIATATTTALVSGVAGKSIFVCGWHVTSTQSAANTFSFISGTQGTPCGTPTSLTPAFAVTSSAPSADHIDYAHLQVPVGAQLCVVTTGATVGTSVMIWFNQF